MLESPHNQYPAPKASPWPNEAMYKDHCLSWEHTTRFFPSLEESWFLLKNWELCMFNCLLQAGIHSEHHLKNYCCFINTFVIQQQKKIKKHPKSMVNIRKTTPSNPAASCSIISSALCWQPFFPPIIQTQCLQVCLSNVIYWSGIPLIPSAALSDSIIYSLGCHATTLIHWLSSLIQCRGCNFTFHCALLQAARTNSPHSLLITNLCWNTLIKFIFLTPKCQSFENSSFPEDSPISSNLQSIPQPSALQAKLAEQRRT